MQKACIVCGVLFRVKPSHAKFRVSCGRDCMAILYQQKLKGSNNPNWRQAFTEKPCAYCGTLFRVRKAESGNRKHCSRPCKNQAKKTFRQCAICPNERLPGRVYCSQHKHFRMPKASCAAPVRVTQVSLTPDPKDRISRLSKKCRKCDVPIPANRVYCKACSSRGNSHAVSTCKVCLVAFSHQRSARRLYCSKGCYLTTKHGSTNPNWKGGRLSISQLIRSSEKSRRLIRRVLARDRFTCQICGQVGGDLEVDHVITFASILHDFLVLHPVLDLDMFARELLDLALQHRPFWNPANLRTLCRKCNWHRELNCRREKAKTKKSGFLSPRMA